MKVSDFNYNLPEELIAQTPLENRDSSKLLILDKKTGDISHHNFFDIINRKRFILRIVPPIIWWKINNRGCLMPKRTGMGLTILKTTL